MRDAEWKLFEDIFFGKERKGLGMPAVHPRNILNSLLFIFMTGGRWCDEPISKKRSGMSEQASSKNAKKLSA
ncbi:transposase [Desulfobulbus sp. F4]|nr:transposase [Desulfobulbus sp. F4]